MKVVLNKRMTLALALAVVSLNCSKKKETTESTTNPDGTTKLTEVSSVSELGVSSTLGSIALPAAYDPASNSSLNITSGKKSRDACRIGSTIREVAQRLSSAGNFFCHLEVEAENIKFGTKYKITTNGEEFGRVWADNSKASDGQITLYMCKNGELSQRISITGVKLDADKNPIGAKGSMQEYGSQDTQSWASSIDFDNKVSDASLSMTSMDKYEDSANSGSFMRYAKVKLFEAGDGVSIIDLASQGNWGGAFADRGRGLSNGDFGHTLFNSEGTFGGNAFSFTHDSFFDGDGVVVSDTESDEFAEGGTLASTEADLPDFLDEDFAPDAPEGWDCEVEETVDLDPESAAHQACETEWVESANCWGTDFEDGQDAQ